MKKFITILSTIALLSGCSGTYTRMANSDLEITTNMNKTIWLNPTVPENTKIFVQVRNTSDNQNFNDLNGYITRALEYKGYQITTNPANANFVLQANVVRAISINRSSAMDAQNDAVIAGTGVGLAVANKNDGLAGVGAGLAAGLATMYFDANTKDITYNVQTDIRITEGKNNAQTTMLTVNAKRVNLTPEEASTQIKQRIANSLAGLF